MSHKIYSNKKVFFPRLASNEVWKYFVENLNFEDAPMNMKYFDYWFSDVLDDEKLPIGAEWLLENGASISESVILDMS